MNKEDIIKIILDIIKGDHTASLATIKDGKPWVRYIMCTQLDDTLHLYTATSLENRKIGQLQKDPNIHITMGWNEAEQKGPYLQIAGEAVIHTDAGMKEKCWLPVFEQYYGSPDNPLYCIIEFIPHYIEVWGYGNDMMNCLTYEIREES